MPHNHITDQPPEPVAPPCGATPPPTTPTRKSTGGSPCTTTCSNNRRQTCKSPRAALDELRAGIDKAKEEGWPDWVSSAAEWCHGYGTGLLVQREKVYKDLVVERETLAAGLPLTLKAMPPSQTLEPWRPKSRSCLMRTRGAAP